MQHEITLWNWHDDIDNSSTEADNLHALDLVRVEHPILHILVMGTRTVHNMSVRIGWPADHILWQLREYKKEGLVFDHEGLRSVNWFFSYTAQAQPYLDLKDWVALQRRPLGLLGTNNQNKSHE